MSRESTARFLGRLEQPGVLLAHEALYEVTVCASSFDRDRHAAPAKHGLCQIAGGFALVGPGVAAAHVLPWSMLPDVVEADRAATGQDRAGAFYGAMTFLEKSATALALWGLGIVLDLAGYAQGAATQPASARLAICVLIGPIPAVVLLGAALYAWRRPPMTRDTHHAIVASLGAAN